MKKRLIRFKNGIELLVPVKLFGDLKNNKNDLSRLGQCFNCKNINTCNYTDNECEDEKGMCQYCDKLLTN